VILIKKFYLICLAICLPIILFFAWKQGTPLAIAEPSNKIAKPVVKLKVNDAKNEETPQKVNPVSSLSVNRHIVGNGESLYLIAQKYRVTVQSLMNANGLTSTAIYPGQTLTIPAGNSATPPQGNDSEGNGEVKPKPGNPWLIKVSKYNHTLDIYYQGQEYLSYHVELGDNGLGAKLVAGDHKTPEGTFYITEKSVLNPEDEFLGSRWMRLSYPNIADAQRGLQEGIIDRETYNEIVTAINEGRTPPQKTALGGGVGIHGGDKPEFNHDWTWGCVGLANKDIETFFDNIPAGTPVIIQK
jgi:LysM repeat protein